MLRFIPRIFAFKQVLFLWKTADLLRFCRNPFRQTQWTCKGAYVIPGLVDVHNHGNSGRDFSDGDYEGLKTMAAYLGRCGVTSLPPLP